jgi:hypothetical protein
MLVWLMIKFIRKTFTLNKETIEKLRKFSYVNRTSESKIIRDALKFYFKTPQPATDPNQETNYDHATMDMEELGNK